MLKRPFNGTFPVTQTWGINKDTYAHLGLLGHNGVDYGTPSNTPIIAPHDGTVLEVANDTNGYGLYVKIENEQEGSILAHLSRQDVSVGDVVSQGQQVGLSGNSGWSTGPHLHWGYYRKPRNKSNGFSGTTNPWPYLEENTKAEENKPNTPFYKEEAYDLWFRSLTSDYHKDKGEGMKRYIADFKKAQVERDTLQSALSKALEDIKTLRANNQALLDAQEENYILRSEVEREYIKKEEQEQAFSELTSKHNEIVLNLKNELTACENRLPETQTVLYEYKTPLGRVLGELALIVDGYKR